jgi:hypothetical protein
MAANRERGEVEFTVDGRTWTLVFDFNAICSIESALDISMDEIGERLGRKPRAGDIRVIFAIGLQAREPATTPEIAGMLITALGPQRAGELLAEAFRWASEERAATASTSGEARPQPPAGG